MRTSGRWVLVAVALAGCNPDPEPFALAFAATDGTARVDCSSAISGLGPTSTASIGLSDLRFYVSNLVLWDEQGEAVETALDSNEFQYAGASGWVGLVDLTSNASGACAAAISGSEGTARTNEAITGSTLLDDVVGVSFDVGLSQPLMKEIIGTSTAEAAPSPLNEMYWSWASGYRHFVFNMTVQDGEDAGEGYVHLGSLDCAAEGELALENRDACGVINTPAVELPDFSLTEDTVTLDVREILAGVDFKAPVYDPVTFEVIGEQLGVECHSFPGQPHCAPIFSSFGLDPATGGADPSAGVVFGVE